MTQNYEPDCFGPTHIAQDDLQKMKDNFECLRTSFAGTVSPPLAEGLIWLETDTNILRVQKAGTGGWLGILTGDTNQKIWIYRNDTLPGWVVDDTVIDRVLALRGGEYGPAGGIEAGTWVQPDHLHHFVVPGSWVTHTHQSFGTYTQEEGVGLLTGESTTSIIITSIVTVQFAPSNYEGDTEGSATISTWRPAAAVGTMQYINVLPS